MIPTIEIQIRRILEREGLTEAEWAARANVTRKQVYLFLDGANICRDTIDKLAAPLGVELYGVDWQALYAAGERLAALEAFLARLQPPSETMEKALLYFGLPVSACPRKEISDARARLAEAKRYLELLEDERHVSE